MSFGSNPGSLNLSWSFKLFFEILFRSNSALPAFLYNCGWKEVLVKGLEGAIMIHTLFEQVRASVSVYRSDECHPYTVCRGNRTSDTAPEKNRLR